MEKECFKCGAVKSRDEFYRHPQMADGLLGKCKECTKADTRSNREANIKHYIDYDRRRASLPHRVAARKEYNERVRPALRRRKGPENNPIKRAARVALGNAVRDGKVLKPGRCEECGIGGRIHGHHDDYSKPLDVRWLCASCHAAVHKAMREPHPETGRLYNRYE